MDRDRFTKVVRLSGLRTREGVNARTAVAGRLYRARFSAREVAGRCREGVRALWADLPQRRERGVLLVGADPGAHICGYSWLPLSEEPSAAVVGRHEWADLCLPSCDELSLRHVLVLARWSRKRPSLRILDLRTPTGFRAEDDERVTALEADGPLVLSLPGYALLAVLTGEGVLFPDSFPRARYLEKRVGGEPQTGVSNFPYAAGDREARSSDRLTNVTTHEGIIELPERPLLLDDEKPLGELSFSNRGQPPRTVVVGPSAVGRGIVLGRYPRCDIAGRILDREDLSRVHALVIQSGPEVYLCDAGSTNGVYRNGQEVRVTRLERDVAYTLSTSLQLAWRPSRQWPWIG